LLKLLFGHFEKYGSSVKKGAGTPYRRIPSRKAKVMMTFKGGILTTAG